MAFSGVDIGDWAISSCSDSAEKGKSREDFAALLYGEGKWQVPADCRSNVSDPVADFADAAKFQHHGRRYSSLAV
jgi:hypothetical protein